MEIAQAIQTLVDGLGLGLRPCQEAGQPPRSCRRDATVHGVEQTSRLLTLKRAAEFEIGPRCSINLQALLTGFALWNTQMRHGIHLRQGDVIQQGPESSDLGA